MIMDQWASKWGISQEALTDLKLEIGMYHGPNAHVLELISEAGASKQVRLAFAHSGGLLWRNNVGAMQDDTGRVVRYGLANESKAMNKSVKSSDLIGINPVVIQPDMVGHTIGQFVAREMKKPGWKYRGTAREEAQLKFIQLVLSRGGDAAFSTGEEL